MQSPLEAAMPVWLAIALATACFTLVHGVDAWYSHALSGAFYGFALVVSGSIWLPVLLHGTSNLLIALLDAVPGADALLRAWSAAPAATLSIGVAALLAATLWLCARWARLSVRTPRSR